MTINESQIPFIVQKLCPILVFHPKERVLPCSIETMVGPYTGPGGVLTSQTPVEIEKLSQIPMYYVVNETERSITYIICYEKDLGTSQTCLGGHDWDVEFVRIFYDSIELDILSAYYSAHSSDQGTWVCKDDMCLQPETGRPYVYVSLNSHANYPKRGTYCRIFFFANDVTVDRHNIGVRWDPQLTLAPMQKKADLEILPKWSSFMQWSYPTYSLKGINYPQWFHRFAYPLFK